MTDKVCAALVGLDNPHSKGWLTSLQHCEAVGRLVVCAAEECTGVDQVYGSLDALLADEKLGLAIVCTRNDQAPDLIAQLLQAGVPVIAEKPVARTAADIVRLNEIAAAQQVLWATAFLNRCHPIADKTRELIAAGVLGRIVSIEGRMVTSTVQQRNPDHWLFDRALAGGGILHWLAIHTVDLIRYISGLEYRSVSAHKATLSGTDIDVEDVLAASFCMDNGALGSLHAGYVLPRRYGDIYLCFRGTAGDATWVMQDWDGRGRSTHRPEPSRGMGRGRVPPIRPVCRGSSRVRRGGRIGFHRRLRRRQPWAGYFYHQWRRCLAGHALCRCGVRCG